MVQVCFGRRLYYELHGLTGHPTDAMFSTCGATALSTNSSSPMTAAAVSTCNMSCGSRSRRPHALQATTSSFDNPISYPMHTLPSYHCEHGPPQSVSALRSISAAAANILRSTMRSCSTPAVKGASTRLCPLCKASKAASSCDSVLPPR